jgi:hypothetical protein
LATDFLQATQPNSVKIFTTGHSLGGAMCSNFAYLWMGVKKTEPYISAPYNVLADNIICISLGSPRCMGKSVANKFCNFAMQNKILYKRITTRGDPVPALPPKTGFQHPCSDNSKMRLEVSEDCNATLTMRPLPNVNYSSKLDCLNYKARAYIPNALSHTIYLDILYTKAVDIPKFFKGIGIAQEVSRDTDKSTVCRLVTGSNGVYKAVFFNVNKAREKPTNIDVIEEAELSKPTEVNIEVSETTQKVGGGFFDMFKKAPAPAPAPIPTPAPPQTNTMTSQTKPSSFLNKISMPKPSIKIGGEIAEDRRMTMQAFNSLIQQMAPIQGNLCPQSGQIINPFNNQIMPDLSCPGLKLGGKRRNKRTHKKKKYLKKNKSRRY